MAVHPVSNKGPYTKRHMPILGGDDMIDKIPSKAKKEIYKQRIWKEKKKKRSLHIAI